VSNKRLRGALESIYARDQATTWVGDGKVGSAVREELRTGEVVGDPSTNGYHYGKAANAFNALSDILDEDRKARVKGEKGTLTDRERVIAMDEARELWTALNGEDVTGNFHSRASSTPQGRAMLENAKKVIARGASRYAVKEFTGTPFQQIRRNGEIIKMNPAGPARLTGVANLLGVAGDALMAYEFGKALASDDPEEAVRQFACSIGTPVCAGTVGRDGLGTYYSGPTGEIYYVPDI